jgi:putative SbcD/Mre11-related phosphoesterase
MKFKFLTEPALLIEPEKLLILADLHIGLEQALYEGGITIPSQFEKLKERLRKIIDQTKAKHLVIVGDVKHDVKGISVQEHKELADFFNCFSDIKISVVKGNHDGDIDRIIPKEVDIYDSKGFVYKNLAFTHGQSWPLASALDVECIFIGHVHPLVEFWTDNVRIAERCWIRCKVNSKILEKKYKKKNNLKEAIIIPAFNHLMGGVALNSKSFKPKDPIFKALDLKTAEVYLLDGTYLGNLRNLKPK